MIVSVFPALSLCSYSVGQSFIYFPSLTGSKPACIIGNTGRDRPVVVVFLWKLVYECCTLVITCCSIYVRTLEGWFSPSRPKINLFAFTFSSSGVKILENCHKKKIRKYLLQTNAYDRAHVLCAHRLINGNWPITARLRFIESSILSQCTKKKLRGVGSTVSLNMLRFCHGFSQDLVRFVQCQWFIFSVTE